MKSVSDTTPEQTTRAVDFPLLAWLFLTLAAAHACAAAADLLPGGPGPLAAAVDASVAFAVLAGLAVRRWAPETVVSLLAVPALVAGVVLAGFASGVRAAAAGEPWFGADVVLAVFAAVGLPNATAFTVAVVGAEAAGGAAFLVGLSGDVQQRPSAAGLAVLITLGLFAAGAAVGLRWSAGWLRAELDSAVRVAGLQSVTDPLTGANNRRGLERHALPMIEHARRQGEAVHCLFIDVDSFRLVNEKLGRERGDEVLGSVHEALLASIRATDVVARWAGDQFVVLGPGTGTSPLEMERRVRAHLSVDPPAPADVWSGAVSIGSATLVPWDEGNLDSLLTRAEEDMQLRRSLRRQGRSRSRSGSPSSPITPSGSPPQRGGRHRN
jgi:diguanylate cyclase (GGDEF)-like protein